MISLHTVLAAGIKQNLCAHYVRLQKDSRVFNRTIHMAFRRKMDHRVDFLGSKKALDRLRIGDIHPHKGVPVLSLHTAKVRQIARVG